MSFSGIFFHNPNFTISSSSSSFKPRRNLSSSNQIFTTNKPKPLIKKLQIIDNLAARDTIIDFGKHKGKMLGTLPSSYLKWVSKNLRAGDTEYWAKLADEVLEDDVYKDRSEWEIADKILRGSDERTMREEVNSVSMLLEISERFGWDNEDKIGWSKVNFELLGTSKGGRIPRLRKMKEDEEEKVRVREIKKKEEDENGRRRRQRRERLRQSLGRDDVNRNEQKSVLGKVEDVEKKKVEGRIIIQSPFPGRESLLKKVMMNKRKSQ